MKEYFVTVNNNSVIISKNPNPKFTSYKDTCDLTKRYLYKEGDKIVNPWGQIETIKEIIRDYCPTQHGHEWLIMVEENGNQYKPCELGGIVVKTLTNDSFNELIK